MTKALLNLGVTTLALILASAAFAAEGTSAAPLRPMSECLDPQQARGWAILDAENIVVDAGRRKFLIRFHASCSELNWTPALQFRTANGVNRVCGHANEAVVPETRGGIVIPCTIASITLIDAARYRALTTDTPKNGDADGAAPVDAGSD